MAKCSKHLQIIKATVHLQINCTQKSKIENIIEIKFWRKYFQVSELSMKREKL